MIEHDRCHAAVCVDPNCTRVGDQIYHGKKISFVRSVDDQNHSLIVMMDVLEHVADDKQLLKEYSTRLAAEGRIFITVPAFMFVFSGHDLFLEHHRRYTIRSLESVLYDAGLIPIKMRYYFASLFPVVAGIRLAKSMLVQNRLMETRSELKWYPAWLNKLLLAIHDIERQTLFPFNRAFGLSIFCLCRQR